MEVNNECNHKKKWSPFQLFPLANQIIRIIMGHRDVSGVAITGSLSRLEPEIHDIDLIVFHNNRIEGLVNRDPSPRDYKAVRLEDVFGKQIAGEIKVAQGAIPVSFIFTPESVLWDCEILQILRSRERLPDFYRTVFCQAPLRLLLPVKGGLLQFTEELKIELYIHFAKVEFEYIMIRHRCGNPRCKPSKTLSETLQMMFERKKICTFVGESNGGESG